MFPMLGGIFPRRLHVERIKVFALLSLDMLVGISHELNCVFSLMLRTSRLVRLVIEMGKSPEKLL